MDHRICSFLVWILEVFLSLEDFVLSLFHFLLFFSISIISSKFLIIVWMFWHVCVYVCEWQFFLELGVWVLEFLMVLDMLCIGQIRITSTVWIHQVCLFFILLPSLWLIFNDDNIGICPDCSRLGCIFCSSDPNYWYILSFFHFTLSHSHYHTDFILKLIWCSLCCSGFCDSIRACTTQLQCPQSSPWLRDPSTYSCPCTFISLIIFVSFSCFLSFVSFLICRIFHILVWN
jgi:hypothetical protein